jgi:hypothetical protein
MPLTVCDRVGRSFVSTEVEAPKERKRDRPWAMFMRFCSVGMSRRASSQQSTHGVLPEWIASPIFAYPLILAEQRSSPIAAGMLHEPMVNRSPSL